MLLHKRPEKCRIRQAVTEDNIELRFE